MKSHALAVPLMRSVDPATLDPRVRTLPVLVLDDVEGGLRMRFRAIPAGCFVMGSRGYSSDEEPQHTVVLPPISGRADGVAFWLAETPVTQRRFRMWTQSRDYEDWREKVGQSETHANHFTDQHDAPAESLNWFEADGYCSWLGSRPWSGDAREVLRGTSIAFGLPTEVEWEYACRAGTDTEFWSGDGDGALQEAGWFEGNSLGRTRPVGLLSANAFGLFDMHGNVFEWISSQLADVAFRSCDAISTIHPAQARSFLLHSLWPRYVLKGGSYGSSAALCRAASRLDEEPSAREWDVGLRVSIFSVSASPSGPQRIPANYTVMEPYVRSRSSR